MNPPTRIKTLDHVLLYPDDIENEKLVQVKCTKCGCINPFWKDLPDYKQFMEKGCGLHKTPSCIRVACECHNGGYPLPRILTREVSLEQALGKLEPLPSIYRDLNE